jgi:fibronectin type 3 domain-containing protein
MTPDQRGERNVNWWKPISTRNIVPAALALLLGFAVVPKLSGQANVTGKWSTLSYTMPINPVHAALLGNGKILIIAGSGNCPPSQSGCPSGAPYGPSNGSGALLLDPVTGPITQFSLSWDMFCNGMVLLPDGRPFVLGGTIVYDPFHGQPKTSIFDPANNTFTDGPSMAHGRWYPTGLTLGDGRTLTFSGLDENGATNNTVELYTVGSGWSQEYTTNWSPDLYPRLHLLPNGQVFYAGSIPASALFDLSTGSWIQDIANTNYCCVRTYGTSVLLPLTPANNYDPQVIIMGGNSPATATTEIIDMGTTSPQWQWGPSMSQPRVEMNAVILPSGKILAVGGSAHDEDTSSLSLNADLYDPISKTFSSAGANASERLYHSVALLLPDATVWLAGGNPGRGTYNNTIEIYQPAYLFNPDGSLATRPSLTAAPSSITYGNNFTVQTPDAANISSVVLVRNGTVTHAFGMDQREVGLSFTAGNGTLTVTPPPNGNIAPPGYYMLFLLNSSGVPSLASFVELVNQVPPAPTNLTVTAGNGQVGLSWSTSSGATSYNVKRSTTSGGPYTTIASPTTTSYTDTGLTNGTTYFYVVSAVNTAGESANSSQVSATPQLVVPPPPTNLVAAAGNGQVGLSWSASSEATSYNVKRSATSGGPYTTIASPTTTSYMDSGVTNGTTYYYVVSAVNTAGESTNSSQVSATPALSTTLINYGGGFTSSGLQLNGSTTVNGTRLRLTDGGGSESSSAFYTTPVNVQSFTTNFSFQMTSAAADGMAFVIQNGAATALGGGGGNLGYAGIGNSVAVKFDIYSNAGEGTDSTGMYVNGAVPTVPAVDMTSSGVNLLSGDVMNVQLVYDGTTLTLTITDATTLQKFTTSWTVNIPTSVGRTTALVGFTGGTGGLSAIQDVLSWTYSVGSSTNPPPAPTNVTATAGNGQVRLSWNASSGATSDNVKRSTTSGGPYTTIASPTTTSYTDTGVTNGTTYFYVVSAVNTAGESANSSQVSATPSGSVSPSVVLDSSSVGQGALGASSLSWSHTVGSGSNPVLVVGVVGGCTPSVTYAGVSMTHAGQVFNNNQSPETTDLFVLTAPATGKNTVQVSYSGCTSDVEAGSISFTGVNQSTPLAHVTTNYGSGSSAAVTVTSASGDMVVDVVGTGSAITSSSQTLLWLKNQNGNTGHGNGAQSMAAGASSVTMGYSVTADWWGIIGADVVASSSLTVPPPPTNLVATAGNAQVGLSWSASSGATSYNVKRSTTSGGPYTTIASPTMTSYTDTGLTNGTTYFYVVSAVNTAGESTNSSQVSATPQAVPAAPTNLVATAGNAQVGLSWSASSGATSYNVKRSTTSGGPYTTIASPTTTSYTDTGLTNGTTYFYVVSAVNAAGQSANSSQVSATPQLAVPPPVPTNLVATAGNAQVGLSWSASSGATSYNVQRSTTSGGPYTSIGTPTTTSYTDTGVTNGTTYYYVVAAVNAAGQSANSSQVSSIPSAWVKRNAVGTFIAASGTDFPANAFSVALTNPSLIIATCLYPAGVTPATPKDTATNNYVDSGQRSTTVGSSSVAQTWYALNTHTTASNIVHCKSVGTTSNVIAFAYEWTGNASSSPVDGGNKTATTTGGAAGANSLVLGSGSTTADGDLIVAFVGNDGTPSHGTSPINFTDLNNADSGTEYYIQPTHGSIAPTFGDDTSSDSWGGLWVAFKHR